MESFQPNDIDVFLSKSSQETHSFTTLECVHKKFSDDGFGFHGFINAEGSYNFGEKYVRKRKLMHHLLNSKTWGVFDWHSLLDEFPCAWMANSHIFQTFKCAKISNENNPSIPYNIPYNIIVSHIPWHNAECFTINVLKEFDMAQCAVGICCMTRGTFYPGICLSKTTMDCIKKREIKFGWNFGFNLKSNLQRLSKYMDRGFGLKESSPVTDTRQRQS